MRSAEEEGEGVEAIMKGDGVGERVHSRSAMARKRLEDFLIIIP